MTDRERYLKLDEIGFVGTQEKRSAAQIKKDAELTSRYIQAMKEEAKSKKAAQGKKAVKVK